VEDFMPKQRSAAKPWQAHRSPAPPYSKEDRRPNEKDIFFVVGVAILTCQIAERFLKFYLIELLPEVDPKTLERLFSSREQLRKATLGRLIILLRERTKIDQDFQVALAEFLDMRNCLAHSAAEIEGWNFATHEGAAVPEPSTCSI
jgi:hypothetical protein